MGLLDELLKAQKPKRNLMDTQMVKGPDQPYLRQDYPTVYGALGGLLGTAPDVMEGSVLDPNTAAVRQGAEYGFPVGTALGMLPMARFTKGLPVGRGIKPINLEKGMYRPELTMEEMLKVKDIPTVERVRKSMELVGEKEFENMVNAQFKKYKPTNQDTEAMLVESVTLNILGKAQRAPYPQQAALDLAQQRAALPVSEGGLGLPVGMGIKDVGESPFVVYRGGTKGKAIATEGLDPGSVQLGQGAYFGSSKGMAEEFAKYRPEGVVEAYHLNLKTPFDETAKIIPSTEQMQSLRKNLIDIGVPKIYVDELEQPYRGAITNLSDAFSKKLTRQGKPTTNWQAADKINSAIRKSGFDGIIADVPEGGEHYVAFSKNQFKPLETFTSGLLD